MDKVVHFEIPAENLERAKKFYKGLFDWQFNKVDEMDYHTVCTVKSDKNGMPLEFNAINGGLMLKNSPKDSATIVINVKNLEKSLKKIENAGGKTVLPTQKVKDIGLYARFQDTEGNIIGLWQDLKEMH